MPEVTGPQAAEIIGVSLATLHRRIDDGTLHAREQGTGGRKTPFVEIDNLRQFATTYGYRFDEALAKQYTK